MKILDNTLIYLLNIKQIVGVGFYKHKKMGIQQKYLKYEYVESLVFVLVKKNKLYCI